MTSRSASAAVLIFVLAMASLGAPRASAQFIGYTSPQSAQQKVFSGQTTAQTTPVATVSCTPVNGTPCGIPNIGQTVHFLTYTVAGSATAIQIRLEGSSDGSIWSPISDDATDLTQGEVVAVGYYPALRANLVTCAGCGGGVTLTANYSGVSASPSVPFGSYNPSQQFRKVLWTRQNCSASPSISQVVSPYGSTYGMLILFSTGSTGASPSFHVTQHTGETSADVFDPTVASGLAGLLDLNRSPCAFDGCGCQLHGWGRSLWPVQRHLFFLSAKQLSAGYWAAPHDNKSAVNLSRQCERGNHCGSIFFSAGTFVFRFSPLFSWHRRANCDGFWHNDLEQRCHRGGHDFIQQSLESWTGYGPYQHCSWGNDGGDADDVWRRQHWHLGRTGKCVLSLCRATQAGVARREDQESLAASVPGTTRGADRLRLALA